MLKDSLNLVKAFQDAIEKSQKECNNEVEKIRQLILDISPCFRGIEKKSDIKKFTNSLVYWCYLESIRISAHILYLSCCGLYRNAFNNIRYLLESIVQSLYIDTRHPSVELPIKLEILREVEDKREYRSARLIDELEIDYKDSLKKQYKELSRLVHPSHEQVLATFDDITKGKGIPVTINCEEIKMIFQLMKRTYDIFFFLLVIDFPELKESLSKDSRVTKCIKDYNLTLLSKVLKV